MEREKSRLIIVEGPSTDEGNRSDRSERVAAVGIVYSG